MRTGFVIEHACPQCGAPVSLEETDRLFQCAYCRVKSCLTSGDYFRYRIPAKTGNEEDVIYFPYWRCKAMVFSCLMEGISDGFVDLSLQGLVCRAFPVSAGIRPQTLKLRFAGPEDAGRFIQPALSIHKMRDTLWRRGLQNAPSRVYYKAHLAETIDLVYMPFRMEERLVDAITGMPVRMGAPSEPLPETAPFSRFNWRVRFIAALCPHCGWDLEGERDALVLTCGHCRSAWSQAGEELVGIKTWCVIPEGPQAQYFPFWRILAAVSGIACDTLWDLIRPAHLARRLQTEDAQGTLRFWTPAFKVAPKAFLRLARNLTFHQPEFAALEETPRGKSFAANFSSQAASESLKITLAALLRPREAFFPLLKDISVTAQKVELVYIPFTNGHHEWTHPKLPVAIPKSLMRLGVHL